MNEPSMYLPSAFAESNPVELHDFIEAYGFGLLVSTHSGSPFAAHLPFLLEREVGPNGTLVGHMARANPLWHDLEGQEILAVFSGPHAYVSPSWYEVEDVVPTWNYTAVHAQGMFRLVDGIDAMKPILLASVARFERSMPTPWTIDEESDFFEKTARGIVGFRVEIRRLEGKYKLSQNQPEERREKVIRALAESAREDDREVARLMIERRSDSRVTGQQDETPSVIDARCSSDAK